MRIYLNDDPIVETFVELVTNSTQGLDFWKDLEVRTDNRNFEPEEQYLKIRVIMRWLISNLKHLDEHPVLLVNAFWLGKELAVACSQLVEDEFSQRALVKDFETLTAMVQNILFQKHHTDIKNVMTMMEQTAPEETE